ncbi:MAG: Verru_Chthon cassette protein A [Verrucomicrobiales bacterium]|nr:Verru_Chthon cassette protein A [Verrucomicrobiales bacterium]
MNHKSNVTLTVPPNQTWRGVSASAMKRGAALLLVLGSLVLLGALTLAFLGGIKGNLQTSKLYADGSSARTLAESAVNLVMAQISQATANPDQTWASQPGMIRTYDPSGTTAVECYKLYSWDTLKTTGNFNASGVANELTNWHEQKALFVDLNAPLTTGTVRHYPILNPPMTAAIDVALTGTMRVEGFEVNGAPLETTDSNPNPNPVPMPVKWLYVLQNGEIVAPVNSGNNTVTVNGATQGNPIVGRIAFWTDDETCKVNINTASEGVHWDTPRTAGSYDWVNLAKYQPAQHEYQRYSGHPATVSLSTVFGSMMPVDHDTDNSAYEHVPIYDQYKPYHLLSPKLNKSDSPGSSAGTVIASSTLIARDDRLYASIEEFQFASNLLSDKTKPTYDSGVPIFDGNTREFSTSINNAPPLIDETTLQKAKFFITTNNRSPDVNLFNKPRIGAWPVHINELNRTVFDNTIAFCGTINDYIYYFQREKSDSQTNDLPANGASTGVGRNRQIISYLQDLTERRIPGFSPTETFLTKYAADRDQILTEIFDYIRCLNLVDRSNVNVQPFAVGTDKFKYGNFYGNAGRGQVVPIYDSVNATRGFGRFPTVSEVALLFIATAWRGSGTLPAQDKDDINYMDRNSSVNGLLHSGAGSSQKYGYNPLLSPNNISVQALLLMNFFNPAEGHISSNGAYRVKISGLNTLMWNSGTNTPQAMFSAADLTSNMPTQSAGRYSYGYAERNGGNLGFRFMFGGLKWNKSNSTPNAKTIYPFVSDMLDVPYTQPTTGDIVGTFHFSGTTPIKLEIFVPSYNDSYDDLTNDQKVQEISLVFPEGDFPIPIFPAAGYKDGNLIGNRGDFDWRFGGNGDDDWAAGTNPITSRDTIRSVRAREDMRIIAAQKIIDESYYDAIQPEYGNSNNRAAHSLVESGGFLFWGATLGQLVAGSNMSFGAEYDVRQSAISGDYTKSVMNAGNIANLKPNAKPSETGAFIGNTNYPGDWDNGISFNPDGPYINKADEGVALQTGAQNTSIPYYHELYYQNQVINPTLFSPNRMMPSPVMFGSLSTGVKRRISWQTLLFCPNPAAAENHPGLLNPPDHLLLDLFHMPVVEPYPISEPLSTDGRINMNYQIVPFTYIERSTGIRAVLKAQRMITIPDSLKQRYKNRNTQQTSRDTTFNAWVPIDADKTLQGFEKKFSENDIFKSASEICTLFLYPKRTAINGTGPVYDNDNLNIKAFWQTHRLTGDNSRERPYADIYPRLTTKSNTYMVHMWVQKLQKTPTTATNVWDESRDKVLAEYRGSSTIERYIDPNDDRIPDFAGNDGRTRTLNEYYKFRVLRTSQFVP